MCKINCICDLHLTLLVFIDADDESESYFKTTWDSLDGVINLEFPDVLPVGWNDVYRASSYLGQVSSLVNTDARIRTRHV